VRFLRCAMDYLPRSFKEKVSEMRTMHQARERHLLLLGHEGLHMIERWQATRALKWPDEPKDI